MTSILEPLASDQSLKIEGQDPSRNQYLLDHVTPGPGSISSWYRNGIGRFEEGCVRDGPAVFRHRGSDRELCQTGGVPGLPIRQGNHKIHQPEDST